MAQVRSARAINRAEKTKIARYLLYLLVQIKMERFQFRRNGCKWLTRVKSWVQEHFIGFQWKLDFELSKFQNVRLMSVVLNNANLYEEKGSSSQSFLQGTVIQCCKNNFIRREFSSNARNLQDNVFLRRKCELLTLSNVNVKWRYEWILLMPLNRTQGSFQR